MAIRKLSIVSTQRYTVQLQSSKSYTRQSADLLRQPIELETLDILAMVHDVIADRVDLHNKLRQAVFLLWQSELAYAPEAAVGYLATKGQLVATYDLRALLPTKQRVRARL